MEKIMFSGKGNDINEDAFWLTEQFGFVIDGATGIEDQDIFEVGSDAKWFSQNLYRILKERLSDLETPIKVILKNACEHLKFLYLNKIKSIGKDIAKYSYPTVCISLFRINHQVVEFFQLGDAPIVIIKADEINVFKDAKLNALDDTLLNKMKSLAQMKNESIYAQRSQLKENLIENRLKQNTNEGYWILDLEGLGLDHGRHAILQKSDIKRIVIMSDGFWELYQTMGVFSDVASFVSHLETEEQTVACYQQLRSLQKSDPMCDRYPRLKPSDDATIISYQIRKGDI